MMRNKARSLKKMLANKTKRKKKNITLSNGEGSQDHKPNKTLFPMENINGKKMSKLAVDRYN